MPGLPAFRLLTSALFSVSLLVAPAHLAAQKPYHIIDTWKLAGDGGWDYLLADPAAHRLYLTRGARVDAVDTQSGKLTGAIANLHGAHGVALDTAGKFGYISDGGGNAVVVFDRATLATVAAIPAGTNPDAIVFEPATQTVWAFNGRSQDATVIDAATRKVLATIPLPGKPEFAAVDGQGAVFDNIEDKNELVRIDAREKKITAAWPLTGCDGPSGLTIDTIASRLFSVCHNKTMAVTDAKTGKPLATPAIGQGPDAAAWDAAHKLAFSSNGGGWSTSGASPAIATLTVVDASNPAYPVLEELPTRRGARTMAYDPATDRIYLVTAELGPRPEPSADNPHPRPAILPGSFVVLVVAR